ncbi:hypothetical protein QTP88_025634 [Uroleucon formosanum]
MSETKKKKRQYSTEYIKYGFIQSRTNSSSPMCLICQKTFSNEAMKPSRFLDHFNKMNSDMKDKDMTYFQNMEKKYVAQPTLSMLFSAASKQDDDGLRKPHIIGEDLILPAIKEVITTVLHKPAADIIRKIPLSNSSVQRRIDEMAENIKESLCNHLKTCQFSIQLDESTLPTNEALLLSYVRRRLTCLTPKTATDLETNTKGKTIFNTLENFCDEKQISLKNIMSITTDGAPAMTGHHKGFIAYLKNKVPDVLAVHCVINSQHLVAKNLNFNRLLLHTEVRWLSKGLTCLTRFYNLFDSVIEFLKNKDTDLYKLFNDVNLQLQGDDLNLIKTKTRNIGRREFNNSPNLAAASFINDDLVVYCQHLENFQNYFKERFQDILNMDIPDWVLDPFSNVNTAESSQLEEQLLELTTNVEIKFKFKNGYQEFWLQKPIMELYPSLWSIVQRFLIAFPSSYFSERGFSAVAILLTKKRNRLLVTERGDLRLFLSEFEPDINELVNAHQVHPSH